MIRRLLATALLACALAGLSRTAVAEAPDQVSALCDGAAAGCSLRFDTRIMEGVAYPVVVTGNAGARVTVVVYQATLDGDTVTKLTAISTGGEVTVPNSGTATVNVAVPPIDDDLTGGWALVSLAGVEGTDTSETIGGFVPFGSRIPVLLGDGYGDRKPAGAVLDLQLVGTIPGSLFAVDYADDDGTWHDATAADPTTANTAAKSPADVATVAYEMPRGLDAKPYTFRLRNLTSGTADVTWAATPDATGDEEPRATLGTPPPVGEEVAEARNADQRPTALVKGVSAGVAGLALASVLVAVPLTSRRGRLDD
ncbi:hypothetical protein [Tessaracoccus palaemonis]|uniref:Uncharacterized protein n=1 Tax=Tessaracoccus palaemonis TaxID=2829499 RepID=A0ABX8SLV8_9ACTN|nr:hypothetical protein [Tessaracoccus palaemonis]QXT63610.1 hypothetical protein KDB89_03795 [Tessaracoccus palaemonis]